MKKIVIAASALAFILGAGLVQAGGEKNEAIAKACKDKKPGDKVKVDGKEVKCPKPKK